MLPFFTWWLIIEVLGLVALPVAFRLFRNLPDRGYTLAKPLGLLLTSYAFWILVTFGFLRNTRVAIGFVVLLIAIGTGVLFSQDQEELLGFLRRNRGLVVTIEALFLVAFAMWTLFRAYNPHIMHTEQPMDFGYLNAILRSATFPPHDEWLSGFAISYYYFGYLMMALLTKLSGIPSDITYNLAIALLFAMTVTGAFSVVYNLVQSPKSEVQGQAIAFGVLGSLFVAVIGNLEGFLELLHAKGIGSAAFWQWVDIKDLPGGPPFMSNGWWWWRASRVIHDVILGQTSEVIDEFPFFSFMLGDMHPHVLALPFSLLALALALNLLRGRESLEFSLQRPLSLLYPLCLGALGFLNSWDFPTYALVAIGAYAIQRRLTLGKLDREWLKDVAYTALLVIGLGLALYLPFYIGFQSQAGGVRPVLLVKTRLHQYLIIFGLFIFVIVSLLMGQLKGWMAAKRREGWLTTELWLVGGVSLPLILVSLLFHWWTSLFLMLVIGFAVLLLWQRVTQTTSDSDRGLLFALLLAAVGFTLTLGTEFVYIKDTFNSRMNTVFKFYYQAWVLLAISAAFGVYYVARDQGLGIRSRGLRLGRGASPLRAQARRVWLGAFGALLAASLIYPLAAGYTKAGRFAAAPSLDGIAWWEQHRPGDYAAIQWLRANVRGTPVILEATGGSYSEFGRVSAATGLPTLLGWGGHELQWRGSYDEPGAREPVIARIYQSTDLQEVQRLLDQYDVRYVYVGALEREKYQLSPPQIDKFGKFMDLVYDQAGVRIYKNRAE
ncbi:MAG: DUF2298 domain-containing protein [Anaerolineae bacterium]